MHARFRLETQPGLAPLTRSTHLRTLLALVLAVWLLGPVVIGQCNTTLQSGGPIATLRGSVLATVTWDPDGAGPLPQWLVAGGRDLTSGDQLAPTGLLAYDGAEWHDLGFTASRYVNALAVFNGELVAGGSFTLMTPGGAALNIARRNVTSWSPLGTGIGVPGLESVSALAIFNGEIVAGGHFTVAGGVAVGNTAKWNGTSWAALGPSQNHIRIFALESYGGSLFASALTNLSQNVISRWSGTTWTVLASADGGITSLDSYTGTTQGTSFLVAAGHFTTINGVPAAKVARSNQAVSTWSAMGPGLPQLINPKVSVRSLGIVGGSEVTVTGLTTNSAGVFRWTGSSWNALGSVVPTTGSTAHVTRFNGALLMGLDQASPPPRTPSMFRLTTDWIPLAGIGIAAPVQCLAFDRSDAIAGGAFATADGVAVNGVARRTGTTWSGLGTGMAGGSATVLAVARADNGDVFAGGNFTMAGGNAASNIARWDGTAWAPLGTGTNNTVRALMLAPNGDLIAGGDFTTAGGVACNRIARWNGVAWSQMASGMDSTVRCLATLANGDIVAGGTFVLASGVACNRIARWNGITWSSMNGGTDGTVNALARRPNGDLVAGGAFTLAGGVALPHLARWNGVAWLPLSSGLPDTVNALIALPDGDVLAGGVFATGSMNRLARWNGLSDTMGSVSSGANGPVLAFAAAPNGEIFVGGDFDTIAPVRAAGNLAIVTTNCPALATSIATACVGPGGPIGLVADILPWLGATFRSTASGFGVGALGVSVLGFTPANLPLSQLHPTGLPNCNLLASTDAILLVVPAAGIGHYQFAVPNSVVFAGVQLSHQFVQMALSPSGSLLSLSSSNALRLTLGVL